MKFLVILTLSAFSLASCIRKPTASGHIPPCIMKIIRDGTWPQCNNGASVKEFVFQNRQVFVFDMGHCGADMSATVYDNQCKNLGMLGGIAGFSKIQNEDFYQKARYVRTIWSN